MKDFKEFYVWGMNAKFFMGIYFAATIFFVGIVKVCFKIYDISFLHLAEILLANIIIAFSQVIILKDSDYTKTIFFGKSIAWIVLSAIITSVFSIGFGWFKGMPLWCNFVLGVLMLCGFSATLIGLKFEQEQDTKRLNDDLKAYKNR